MDDEPTTPIPTPQHRPHVNRHPGRVGIAAMAVAGLLGVSGLAYAAHADGTTSTTTTSQTQTQPQPRDTENGQGATILPFDPSQQSQTPATDDTTDATAAQEAGLVYINTTVGYGQGEAAGTGMILTSDGEILTNHHVVEGATSISVQVVSTGTTYDAEVVGYDSTHDVAVLKLKDASGLTTVRTDTSGDVQVGDQVTGVGNANGDGGAASAAAGTVSALDRSITVQSQSGGQAEQLSNLIEVSADIIAGDSGGALYDSDGEVVGMNTAASSGTSDVTGYAVPIAQALEIARQIESGDQSGTIQNGATGFLGVELDPSTSAAVVAGTVDDSPAASAGIAEGSTITAFNGMAISSAEQLSGAVSALAADTTASVTWVDASGSSHTATVTLMAGPIG